MANTSRINGFRPVAYTNGSPYNGKANVYAVDAADATLIGIGDLVKIDGTAGAAVTGDDSAYANVTRAAANDVCVGVVIGKVYENPDGLSTQHRAALTAAKLLVCDDPDIVMAAEADEAVSTTSLGLNINFVVAAASTITGQSAMQVDGNTGNTTNTLPLRLVGFVRSPDNEVNATYNKVLVRFNTHSYKATTGVTGIA